MSSIFKPSSSSGCQAVIGGNRRTRFRNVQLPRNGRLARNEFQIAGDLTGTKLSVDTNGNRVGAVHGQVALDWFPTYVCRMLAIAKRSPCLDR
jgi:hypothetical protein